MYNFYDSIGFFIAFVGCRSILAAFVYSRAQVMAAIQDVSQNGLGAMAKYSNDPEIRDVIEDLKSIF